MRWCCRLNITFTYSMPAVGDARGKKINATQIAVLKVRYREPPSCLVLCSDVPAMARLRCTSQQSGRQTCNLSIRKTQVELLRVRCRTAPEAHWQCSCSVVELNFTLRCECSTVQALATGNESATVADFLTITPDASADLISL